LYDVRPKRLSDEKENGMNNQYDVIVIGSGPGGYVAAIRGARLGLKVALVEQSRLGGVCLNWGCIPTKALLKNAEHMQFLREADKWGFRFDNLQVDFSKIIKRSRKVADASSKGVNYLMKQHNITVVKGRGTLTDRSTVAVLDDAGEKIEILTASHIIIATGGRPRMLPGVETDGKRILTSSDALILKKLPQSMVIIGAGAIGMEFAYFYHTFGTKITVVEMLPSILPNEDEEISYSLKRIYEKAGMQILTGTKVESIQTDNSKIKISVETGDDKQQLNAETCLVAVGVQGNVENIGLEAVGVRADAGAIVVDEFMRTNIPGIYAIGDVVGAPWLAHIASHEGIVCVDRIAGKETLGMDYSSFPGCTYCQPQVASIGLTEKQAREKAHHIKIGKFPFTASGKARAIGHKHGFVKVIFDARYGKILGAHILGPEATEMIAEFGLAKTLEGTNEEIAHTIHAHPTLSEAMMEATLDAFEGAIHI
jgi:dihydrolipoamide dehydrogenase